MMEAPPVEDQLKAAVGVGETDGVSRRKLAGDPGPLEALLGQEEGVVPCATADVQGRPFSYLALPYQVHQDRGGLPLFPGDFIQGRLLVDPVPALPGYAVFRPTVSGHGNLSTNGLFPGRY